MRASRDLERQSVCSTIRAMSLCVKGVQVWNSLCDDLKMVNSIALFNINAKIIYLRNIWLWVISLNYITCKDVWLRYTLTLNMNV